MLNVLRQEEKYPLNLEEAIQFSHRFSCLLMPDRNSANGSYMVRSLYFDTADDHDFFDELFSPLIEVLGIFITILAYCFGLLNVKYMIVLFLVYACFGSMLTLISFLTRNFLSDIRIRKRDILKAFLICIPENVLIRFILAWTRLLSILFYRAKKTNWGSIKRKSIDYDRKKEEATS
ncbi:MAG: hypothetical protein ACI3W6_07960 [Clostridia bacterium]